VCDYRRGFELDIEFIDHLYVQIGTASSDSPITNLHILQITIAHAKSFPACLVFTNRSLVTASNRVVSSASALKSSLTGDSLQTVPFLHILSYRTDFIASVSFLITPRHGPHRQHRSFSYANRFLGNVFASPSNGLHIPVY
jgi:hypothetical protein